MWLDLVIMVGPVRCMWIAKDILQVREEVSRQKVVPHTAGAGQY